MPKAIAEADTFLKKRLLGSTDLADSEKSGFLFHRI
jgi:hypothetical protein